MTAVTLTDVARRAGVSQPTASRVLNGSLRKPAQHIVDAVRKAAEELGYSPNAQAQALARCIDRAARPGRARRRRPLFLGDRQRRAAAAAARRSGR